MASAPSFISVPKTPTASFANADATAFKPIYTGGALGSRIDTLFASNSDPANAYVLQLALTKSSVDYVIGEVAVPMGAGTNGSAKSVAVLNQTDIPGLAYTENGALYLEVGIILRARVKSTVAGSNTVQVCGVGGDY